jgi:hypothetical protein
MRSRPPIDHKLLLKAIPVVHADGHQAGARAQGNDAAWALHLPHAPAGALLLPVRGHL